MKKTFLLIWVLFTLSLLCGGADKAPLKIGWASADISTKEPVLITGQFYLRISKGILDPITATALWIDNGKDSVCFLSADLISVGSGLLDDVAKAVRLRNKEIPVNKIIFNATHTHTSGNFASVSPVVKGDHTSKDLYRTPTNIKIAESSIYRKFLIEKLASIICKAYENRQKGSYAYGYGYATVGRNRRSVYDIDFSKQKGAVKNSTHGVNGHAIMYGRTNNRNFYGYEGGNDSFVNLFFTFDKNNKLTGAIINVPCPSQNSEHLQFLSASFWHETREMIRKKYGNIFILPQSGAAGDLAPRQLHYLKAEFRRYRLKYGKKDSFAEENRRKDIAGRIFTAFDEVYSWAKKDIISSACIRHSVKDLSLPWRHLTKEDYEDAVKGLERLNKESFVPEGKDPLASLQKNSRLVSGRKRYKAIISRWEMQQKKIPYKTQIHVLNIGDVAFASNQFELYQDYQLRIQARSPFTQTFVIQLTAVTGPNGGTYLATKRSVENKGYGSDRFSNRVSWKGGDMLVEETLKILHSHNKKKSRKK